MRILILFSALLCFAHAFGNNIVVNTDCNVDNQQKKHPSLIYRYGVRKLDKADYIHNLDLNVQSYLRYQDWCEGQREEFRCSYMKYIEALKEDRLSADSFGTITDSAGKLGNADGYDYWYDKDGNRITNMEYWTLSKRRQKKYKTFSANREVALYFNTIARSLAEATR